MRVVISAHNGASVEDGGNLGELRVDADLGVVDLVAAVADSGLGVVDGDHVFLDVARLRQLAVHAPAAEWSAKFDGMIRFAASKGWCDAKGRIRAHVERPASAS